MRGSILCVCALAVACGGEPGRTPPSDAQPGALADLAVAIGPSPVDAGTSGASGDLAGVLTVPCGGCGASQVCNGTSCVDLPAQCPCPLGSYCDLKSNACVRGCLGNDHCPSNERCDTSVYQCALACKESDECPGHLVCNKRLSDGSYVCPSCIEAHGDMGASCECTGHMADCNGDPADGCETLLGTLTDCSGCGMPATERCVPDNDHDGYGVSSPVQIACGCPSGTIDSAALTKGVDCDDANAAVNPGETAWFTSPRASGSFDYDCDGVVETEYDYGTSGKCDDLCNGNVWDGPPPACGATGNVFNCYVYMNACNTTNDFTATQGCH
jgi:hypothetical protein